MHVAIVGTYPPLRCGIATFTADVESALRINGAQVTVVAVDSAGVSRLAGDALVGPAPQYTVARDDLLAYTDAGERVSQSGCDVVVIEHEFGIFGGEAGAHVLELTAALEVPYVVTLHTVLPRFSAAQANVLRTLCGSAAAVTVFTPSAQRMLADQQITPSHRVHVVAHGAPSQLFAQVDRALARRRFDLAESAPVMTTFGLLSQGKGIDLAIRAMALLTDDQPDLRYVVAGTTHPEVIRGEGESYRQSLATLAAELGVADRVVFLDRFLDVDEIAELLGASDVVCTPYRGEDQIVSGVLTFALAAGCPIVSTPYRYARDVLAGGAGLLVDFHDVEGCAKAIRSMLDPETGAAARRAARAASASMAWPTVGAALLDVFERAVAGRLLAAEGPRSYTATARPLRDLAVAHLRVLCDDTAMLQHAQFTIPRLEDGYCVDDVGRMLPIAASLIVTTGDDEWHTRLGRLMAFLRSAAVDGDGRMRNFMSWDRHWLDDPHGGDHVGRAIWGLGELSASGGPFAAEACELLDVLAPKVSPAWSVRSIAYASLGLVAAADSEQDRDNDLDRLTNTLQRWTTGTNPKWQWPEPTLAYDNARIPEALLRIGHRIGLPDMVDQGVQQLAWLDNVCRRGDHYRFPGHRGLSDVRNLAQSGDEQPLEAWAMADAHLALMEIAPEPMSHAAVELSWSWFSGNNRLGEPMFDERFGAGYDGLGATGINRNCGAESTIAVHRCWMTRRAAQLIAASAGGGQPLPFATA